ncbi:hypothetical protein ACF09I_35520 [Streptomyces sp. NPDC014940]|uniref:hypothetical protein n=1 Tax=Streptomyces sp. NPDC014940 TaxID=3364932 RepID=UPI0036FB01BF
MDSELLKTALSAAGAVALVFIGGWESSRRTRRAEERKDAAADRAALEAQANELVAAVLALKVAGNMHDQLYAGGGAKARLFLGALSKGGAAVMGAPGGMASGLPVLFKEMWRIVDRWEQDTAVSAAGLTAPLSRLGAAVAPLMWRGEPGLADAANAVFTVAVDNHGDDERMTQAMDAFQAALRPALALPTPARRRWALRRRERAE